MLAAALLAGLAFQMAQNPSPMTEHTRAHTRQVRKPASGLHPAKPPSLVLLHFHGEPWLAEQAVAEVHKNAAVLGIQAGAGSRVYAAAVPTPESFQALLAKAGVVPGQKPPQVVLSSFSAGYGAIRAILRHSYEQVDAVLLMDSLHSGYSAKAPDPADLDVFLRFARDAAEGRKRMILTHSEVFPATFASTTETADWLLAQFQLPRRAVLRWGPVGMQQLSHTRRGRFAVLGFAGNSAPDHVDHLHGMATWLRALRKL